MKSNYRTITQNIKNRINPENLLLEKAFSDQLSSISYNDVSVFVAYAMKPVSKKYTAISKEAGENVKKHLNKEINYFDYRFQGSVMTNTHIKGYSDIDLLAIVNKFYGWDSVDVNRHLSDLSLKNQLDSDSIKKLEKEKNNSSYTGNALQDLKDSRIKSEKILSSIYKICDCNKEKCIKITNQDLHRDVDLVLSGWYDDVRSIINDKGDFRGIQIYNKHTSSKENPDYPFISIKRINDRGVFTLDRIKKMIRFLKNIKMESDSEIELTSFDINAICYNIPIDEYRYSSSEHLVTVLYNQFKKILTDESFANSILSVDGKEFIFRNNSEKIEQLKKMHNEIIQINFDLSSSSSLYETKNFYR